MAVTMKGLQFLLVYIGLFREALLLQAFDKEPSYTEVNGEEDAKLTCIVLNKKGDCHWQKNSRPIRIQSPKYEWVSPNQENGDCSLWVRKASLMFDDGTWECKVEPSDYTKDDALTSDPVQLVVRVAPQSPRIEHNASPVLPDHNVTVKSGDKAVLKCISRYGNPPAKLKWFLDDEELVSRSNQTSFPEEGTNRTFMAISTLEVYVNKSHRGRTIRCVAIHESYASKSVSVNVKLDITYPPEVQLRGMPTHDLEEGKSLTLTCQTDANPPATVIWQRSSSHDISSSTDKLQFISIKRYDSGTYTCIAKNSVGSSQPVSTTLDVKYSPIIKSVGPDKVTTAPLYTSAEFTCAADGNPPPSYQWLQKVTSANGGTPDTIILRSSEPKLYFRNVTYDYQGEYVCVVTNTIAGTERTVESQPITLHVIGAPQVLKHSEKQEVVAQRGENALLRLVVCADPRPRRTAWEWGSLQLEAGAGVGRYRAEELLQEGREDCYEARLHVFQTDHQDARNYYLTVENERGLDRHAVHLAVRGSYTEPLAMTTVLTVAAGSLVLFMICILLSVYIIKSQKCCFARRGDFKPADSESEKSDINNANGRKPPKIEPMIGNGPNDVMYCTSPIRRPPPPHTITAAGGSPEAMKRKRKTIYESSVKSSCRRSKKRNTFTDLQVPVVSNNGATMNRMANYGSNKKLIPNKNEYPTYFCPFGQLKYGEEVHYNDMRTFPRHGYHTYDKDII